MELLMTIFICIGSYSLGIYVIEKLTGESIEPIVFSLGLLTAIILGIIQ